MLQLPLFQSRAFLVFTALLVPAPTLVNVGAAVPSGLAELGSLIRHQEVPVTPAYTERPTKPYLGPNPKRDPATRGGLWTKANANLLGFDLKNVLAATGEFRQIVGHTTAVEPSPGGVSPFV